MANRTIDPTIREAVEAAVDAAHARGQVSRADIVASFAGKVGQATLYRWIDRRVTQLAATVVISRSDAAPKSVADAVTEMVGGVADRQMVVLRDDASQTGIINFERFFASCLNDCEAMRLMAKGDDGKVRNVRLLLSSVDQLRRVLVSAYRVYSDMEEKRRDVARSEATAFMKILSGVLYEEPADTASRLIAKMNTRLAEAGF